MSDAANRDTGRRARVSRDAEAFLTQLDLETMAAVPDFEPGTVEADRRRRVELELVDLGVTAREGARDDVDRAAP